MDDSIDERFPIDDALEDRELHQLMDIGLALRFNAERDRADAGCPRAARRVGTEARPFGSPLRHRP